MFRQSPSRREAWIRRGRFALLVALLNLALYNVYQIIHSPNPWPDFTYFYAFARVGLVSGDAGIYDPAMQAQTFHALFPGAPWLGYPVVNPPPFAWLLAPLALMPFAAALAVWTGAMITSIAVSSVLVAPDSAYGRAVYVASWLGFLPAYLVFVSAPVAPLVILSVVLTWRLIRTEHQLLAGVVLAIGLLKPTLAILVPFALLAAGYRQVFFAWLVATALVVAASVVALGPSGVDGYVTMTGSFSREVYSLRWSIVALVGDGLPWLLAAAGVVALTLGLSRWLRKEDAGTVIAIGVAGSFLVNHHATPGDLMMLLVPVWFVARSGAASARLFAAIAWGAGWVGLVFPIWAVASAASVPVFLLAHDLLTRKLQPAETGELRPSAVTLPSR